MIAVNDQVASTHETRTHRERITYRRLPRSDAQVTKIPIEFCQHSCNSLGTESIFLRNVIDIPLHDETSMGKNFNYPARAFSISTKLFVWLHSRKWLRATPYLCTMYTPHTYLWCPFPSYLRFVLPELLLLMWKYFIIACQGPLPVIHFVSPGWPEIRNVKMLWLLRVIQPSMQKSKQRCLLWEGVLRRIQKYTFHFLEMRICSDTTWRKW